MNATKGYQKSFCKFDYIYIAFFANDRWFSVCYKGQEIKVSSFHIHHVYACLAYLDNIDVWI